MRAGNSPLKVAVVGGSIGGLCAGIALRGIGCAVDVYERATGAMTSQGAGIVVQDELLSLLRRHAACELPTVSCRQRRYLLPDDKHGIASATSQEFSSWSAIHRTLRESFPDRHYHAGSPFIGFEQVHQRVIAQFAGHGDVEADLLVCADGSKSATRHRLMPDVEPHYAGYVAWRGTIDEADLPPELIRFFDRSFTVCEARSAGHILCYLIPGSNAAIEIGHRRLNWVWYVDVPQGQELERLLTDSNGELRKGSVPPGKVPLERAAELRARASRELNPRFIELVHATPAPFIQMIFDMAVPRMAFGRACLLGDAAFVLRPHIAAATAKAAADATSLAAALASCHGDPDKALPIWEMRQLDYGKGLVDRSAAIGSGAKPPQPHRMLPHASLSSRIRGGLSDILRPSFEIIERFPRQSPSLRFVQPSLIREIESQHQVECGHMCDHQQRHVDDWDRIGRAKLAR
jgi:2-polyprenyl-6-methoxyphenol hydroxylase-like FAD-dependent oxidoreductase